MTEVSIFKQMLNEAKEHRELVLKTAIKIIYIFGLILCMDWYTRYMDEGIEVSVEVVQSNSYLKVYLTSIAVLLYGVFLTFISTGREPLMKFIHFLNIFCLSFYLLIAQRDMMLIDKESNKVQIETIKKQEEIIKELKTELELTKEKLSSQSLVLNKLEDKIQAIRVELTKQNSLVKND